MAVRTHIKILIRSMNNKRVREILCKNFVDENPIITEAIIEQWNLKRINLKYREQTRLYDENSYSKQKIREEEILFIKRHALFQPLRYYFEEQRILQDKLFKGLEKHENFENDNVFYKQTIINHYHICYPISPLIVKKNNRHRIDLNSDLQSISEVREIFIDEYMRDYKQLTLHVIEKFNLKFLTYKYIDHTLTKFESSYTRNKIKIEELFLLNKIYQYSIWLKRIDIFHDLQNELFNNIEFEKESSDPQANAQFLEVFVNSVINEFRDVDFDVADDINLN